ncbi:hypothetical protein HAX54_038408 [Datura stramonium]|uniref:Uncharacterized protein n=1 Tax=Datura stramonium TaxID=4076 RepID=A0ABS8SJ02_DATST|nr:hypothetical protein [Datura stramonium]
MIELQARGPSVEIIEIDLLIVDASLSNLSLLDSIPRGEVENVFAYVNDEVDYACTIAPPRVNAMSFKIDDNIYNILKVESQFHNSINNGLHQYLITPQKSLSNPLNGSKLDKNVTLGNNEGWGHESLRLPMLEKVLNSSALHGLRKRVFKSNVL